MPTASTRLLGARIAAVCAALALGVLGAVPALAEIGKAHV